MFTKEPDVSKSPNVSAAPLSAVEGIKTRSRGLRGSLVESLANPVTGAIADDDTQLIKFHGSYQQDDRDVREERRQQKLEPAFSFMIRTRLPGGVATPQQWLALDAITREFGNGTLKLTTRQAFQVHGVVKRHLRDTFMAMNRVAIDCIAACGDVNRNVMAGINPAQSAVHAEIHAYARGLSEHGLTTRFGSTARSWPVKWARRSRFTAPLICRVSSRPPSCCRRTMMWTSTPKTSASSPLSKQASWWASTSPRGVA